MAMVCSLKIGLICTTLLSGMGLKGIDNEGLGLNFGVIIVQLLWHQPCSYSNLDVILSWYHHHFMYCKEIIDFVLMYFEIVAE